MKNSNFFNTLHAMSIVLSLNSRSINHIIKQLKYVDLYTLYPVLQENICVLHMSNFSSNEKLHQTIG